MTEAAEPESDVGADASGRGSFAPRECGSGGLHLFASVPEDVASLGADVDTEDTNCDAGDRDQLIPKVNVAYSCAYHQIAIMDALPLKSSPTYTHTRRAKREAAVIAIASHQ